MDLKKKMFKFLSSLLTLIMVFTILTPGFASANIDSKPFKQSAQNEGTMQAKMAIAEQLQMLKRSPKLHKDLEKLKGQQDVEVIIHLSEKPVALEQGIKELAGEKFTSTDVKAAEKNIKAQQTSIKKEMKVKKITNKEGYSYQTVLNGFSTTVKADDLKKLLEIEGVTLVEPVVEVHASEDSSASQDKKNSPAMDTSISFLGIEKIWAKGFKGKGIKVAVLDTGIDYDHPDFEGNYKGGFNFIPNSNDYKGTRADDDPYETAPSERPSHMPEFSDRGSSFYTSHGTHVAGTVAAIGNNPYGIDGIAPEVDLYAYRVLGAYGSGTNAGVIAGINKAVEEGMDVINLSLGGGGNDSNTADTIAINNAMLAGTVSVLATGNSGPNRGTIGTPAAAALGIAVGNTTNPEKMYNANVSVEAGDLTLSKQLNLMSTTYGEDLAEQLSGEFDLVTVPGVGGVKDFNGIDVEGKIALIARGDIAFVDKIANAKEAGAIATLIHNSAGGSNSPGISDVFLGDDFEFLPTVDMSFTDGDAIRKALGGSNGTVSFSNIESISTEGDEVNASSSRGPTIPHFDIKPDVSAPGTNIMSTIPMYGKEVPDADYSKAFSRKTGTSMATPHVAGIAALIMNANPEWNAFDVKVALSNTAKVLDTEKFDVFAQGPGRVQPYEAAFPKALAYSLDTVVSDGVQVENTKGTVTFGHHPEVVDGDVSVTKQISVENLSENASDYNVTVEVTKAFGNATVSVDKPTFTLNGEQLLNVTLNASQSEAPAGSELLGYIHITDGETNLSLPFAVDFSAEAGYEPISNYGLTETDLSFNGDGIQDAGRLEFTLNNLLGENYVELWDINDPDGGAYEDGYIGYLHASSYLFPDSYYLDIKGEYFPWGGTGAVAIPDGLYTVDLTAENYGDGPAIISYWDGPLVVKSTSAKINAAEEHIADNTTYEFTGNLVDKYIEYQEELELYGMGYNINTKLATTFEAKNEAGNVVSSGPVNLEQNGSFAFDVSGLADGENTVTISVDDAAGNKAQATYVVLFEEEVIEPEPELVIKNLQPSSDQSVKPGDQVEVSFNSDSVGGEANFTVQLPGQVETQSSTKNPIEEVSPGVYEGTWTVPNVAINDAVIVVELTDVAGNSITEEAKGKITVITEVEEPEVPVIKNLQPSTDQYVQPGDEVEVSFSSESLEGEANFVVQLPSQSKATPQSSASNPMKEVSPGLYKGTWVVPKNLNLDGAVIGVELIDSDGNKANQGAKGKLFISSEQVERISGDDRYLTAVEISQKGWTQSDTVVLARGDNFADALAGAPYAHQQDAPILLTQSDVLTAATLAEIKRLDASKIIILGGTNAINESIENELKVKAYTIERISGDDRFGTAAAIAQKVAPEGADKVVVANGMDYPDALSVASFAAQKGLPILLTQAKVMPKATEDAIEALGVNEAVVLGGETVISKEVQAELPETTRLAGADRYATNIEIAKYFDPNSKHAYVATGQTYADALTGAVLAAKNDSAVLLVHAKVPEIVTTYITDKEIQRLTILGGETAVSKKVTNELRELLQ